MKKTIILILISILLLSGCSDANNTTSSSSDIKKLSSVVSISSTVQNPDAIEDQSSSTVEEQVCIGTEPTHFPFSCDTIEDFKLWSKKRGNADVGINGYTDNPANEKYLNWLNTKKSLIVPIIKEPIKTIYSFNLLTNAYGYYTVLSLNELPYPVHQNMRIYIYGLNDIQENRTIDTVTKDWFIPEVSPHIQNFNINKGTCKWGEYRYINAKGTEIPTTAWFIKDSYLVSFCAYKAGHEFAKKQTGDWQEIYFDYIDFETISLE